MPSKVSNVIGDDETLMTIVFKNTFTGRHIVFPAQKNFLNLLPKEFEIRQHTASEYHG